MQHSPASLLLKGLSTGLSRRGRCSYVTHGTLGPSLALCQQHPRPPPRREDERGALHSPWALPPLWPQDARACLEEVGEAPLENVKVPAEQWKAVPAEADELEGQRGAVEELAGDPGEQVLQDGFRVHGGRLP